MSVFDVIKGVKTRCDRIAEEKRKLEQEKKEREQQRREAEKRCEEERERTTIEKLASGELIQAIVSFCAETTWFGESQGSWDSNRRQVIVSGAVVLLNNHDKDVFFKNLEGVSVHNKKVVFNIHQATDSIFSAYAEAKLGMPSGAKETNRIVDEQLDNYWKSDDYELISLTFEDFGYDSIENKEMIKFFVRALHIELGKKFPNMIFSEPRKNGFGLWAIEANVQKKKRKSLISE